VIFVLRDLQASESRYSLFLMRSHVALSSRFPPWFDVAMIIGLVGGGLQLYQWAGARPLWLDEQMIALNLRDRTFAELAGTLWLGQSAPLGWLMVQRAILLILGGSELALRLVPVLFGIATIGTAVWVGRRWLGPVGASVFVLLCAVGQWISFYVFELKHYSADTFWAFFLAALAVWALEDDADGGTIRMRRLVVWWIAAAIGHWLALGALLVTPGCAVIIAATLLRRAGWRAASQFSAIGLGWLATFALHYSLALAGNLTNPYLQSYWAFALPPATGGLAARLQWLASQLVPFALKPGGSGFGALFWATSALGMLFAIRTRPPLGLLTASVPLSAFALVTLRLVPLHERLSLWVIPALYLGVALFADGVERLARHAISQRSWLASSAAVGLGLAVLLVCFDIARRGKDDYLINRPVESNHALDDRAAVRWLMARRQSGDALLTTRLGLPALWWYGGVRISDPGAGTRHMDGSPVLEVEHNWPGRECRTNDLRNMLKDQHRVLLYLGFRVDDWPKAFDDWLLGALSQLGTMTAQRAFADQSRVMIFDLRFPAHGEGSAATREDIAAILKPPPASGCLSVQVPVRW
jgi:hypothetical protein